MSVLAIRQQHFDVSTRLLSVVYDLQMSSRLQSVGGRRKRAEPAVSGGIPGSYDDKDSNFAW